MEEIVAKTARTLYIVTYAIFLAAGLIFLTVGIFALIADVLMYYVVLLVLGAFLCIMSIAFLIYFIRMPEAAIKLKDGKLYFMNGTICSPTEVETFQSKGMGLDGAMFGFGKLLLSVNGKKIKLKFIKDVESVTKRLFMLKAEYQIKENLAKKQIAEAESKEENNG